MSKTSQDRIQKGITTYDKILLEVLVRGAETTLVLSTSTRGISPFFVQNKIDPQAGDKVMVFFPTRMKASSGVEIKPEDYNEINEDSVLVSTRHAKVALKLSIESLIFNVKDLENRVIQPAVKALSEQQEREAIKELYVKTGAWIGNAENPLTEDEINAASAMLTYNDAPNGNSERFLSMNPRSSSQLKKSMKQTFNPAKTVSDLFLSNRTDFKAYGFDCFDNNYLGSYQFGSACNVDPIVAKGYVSNTTSDEQTNTSFIEIDGIVGDLNVGDKFLLTNDTDGPIMVYSHKSDSSNEVFGFSIVSYDKKTKKIEVSPRIKTEEACGLNKNVNRGVKNGDKLIFALDGGESANVCIGYSKYALAYTALPVGEINTAIGKAGGSSDKPIVKTDEEFGDSVSMWSQADITQFSGITRFDKFYSIMLLNALHAVVIFSNMNGVSSTMLDKANKGTKKLVKG